MTRRKALLSLGIVAGTFMGKFADAEKTESLTTDNSGVVQLNTMYSSSVDLTIESEYIKNIIITRKGKSSITIPFSVIVEEFLK